MSALNLLMRSVPFTRYMDAANALTTANVAIACCGIYAGTSDHLALAAALIAAATIVDFVDGHVARTYLSGHGDRRAFGKQLDSLSDLLNFSVVPAYVILYSATAYPAAPIVAACLILSGALRLAFFGAISTDRPNSYIGLPTTYSAVIFGMALIGVVGGKLPTASVLFVGSALALLQVTGIRFRKFAAKPTVATIGGLYLASALLSLPH